MDSLVSYNSITHTGRVSRISGNSVFISLDDNVQCESCQVKSACGMSEARVKEIEIINTEESFRLYESVHVVIKKDSAVKAVFWAYIFPFILMVGVLLVASLFLTEWIAGLLALFILVPYYLILRKMDSFFKRSFNISVLRLF